VAHILQRILCRDLLKQVYSRRSTHFPVLIREELLSISKAGKRSARSRLEERLGKALEPVLERRGNIDPRRLVVLHAYTRKSVREQSRNDEASILIAKQNSNPVPFEDESVLFKSIDERLSETLVEVYAPVRYDTPAERKVLLERADGLVEEVLMRSGGPLQ